MNEEQYRERVENYCRENNVRLTVFDCFNVENNLEININFLEKHPILKGSSGCKKSWKSVWKWCEAHPIVNPDEEFVREWVIWKNSTMCFSDHDCLESIEIITNNNGVIAEFSKSDWSGARKFCETYEYRVNDHDTAMILAWQEECERLKTKAGE